MHQALCQSSYVGRDRRRVIFNGFNRVNTKISRQYGEYRAHFRKAGFHILLRALIALSSYRDSAVLGSSYHLHLLAVEI